MSIDPETIKKERSAGWREELRSKTKNKDRVAIERVHMPELEPEIRVHHQDREVNRGLTLAQATLEATRCMDLFRQLCLVVSCP